MLSPPPGGDVFYSPPGDMVVFVGVPAYGETHWNAI